MNATIAMVLLVMCPLLGAAAAFLGRGGGRWMGLAVGVVHWVAAAWLAWWVWYSGVVTVEVGGWGAPLGIDLRADGLTVLLIGLNGVVSGVIAIYSWRYYGPLDDETGATESERSAKKIRARYFWPLFLFLWAALNAQFLSGDIFNLYVTLELLSFAAIALITLAGERAAVTAAMRYLLVSFAASLVYLLGVGLLYGQAGTVDLHLLARAVEPGATSWVAMALMTGALMAKAALFPLHFWLPPAHANAPAPVSGLLSSLVVKANLYLLLRLWFEGLPEVMTPAAGQFLGMLGGAAILWGSIQAWIQMRLKLLIAYSTVAQLGYLFLVFPLAGSADHAFSAWSGALVYLAAHGCAKTAMFLAAGNIMRAAGHDRIRDLDGITQVLPLSVSAFALAGMSLVGLPPTGGFVGKWWLLGSAVEQGQTGWVVVILMGSLLAAGYVLRVLRHAFTQVEKAQGLRAVPPVMEWTAVGLALGSVVLGLLAEGLVALLRVGAPLGGSVFPLGGAI